MRESIFWASIRSFFIAFFGLAGLIIAFFLFIAFIGAFSTTKELDIETTYTPEIVANAAGVRKSLSEDAPVILKLNINGIIGTDSLNMQTVAKQLQESREGVFKGDRVKALLLHIESPGGTVVDADGIYRHIKTYKEQYKVPVFAYVDGLCASGGMYIACAAERIYASDVSLIGSVGVLLPSFLNMSQLLEKIGVQSLTLSAGKGKDSLNPLRPWKPGEDDNFKELVNYYYDYFVNVMTTNRPEIDKTKLVKEYGALVFPAQQAKEYGYIDGNGYNFNAVLKMLLQKLGITDDFYQVVQLEKKTWYTQLFQSEASILRGQLKHKLDLPAELDPKLMNQFLYLYRP